MSRTILMLFVVIAAVEARVIVVPDSAPTIQAGIDLSSNGDTVCVEPNRYYENIDFHGRNIVLASFFIFDSSYVWISKTVIDGSRPTHPDTASCVRIVSGEDSTCVLVGFHITGGTGTKWQDEHGAGLFREGGGILIEGSSPVIRNNLFSQNQAIDRTGVNSAGGGAIRVGDGNPRIFANVIQSNLGRYGAGIVLNYTGAVVRNNVIVANAGGEDYGGAGIWCYENFTSPKLVENNTIVDNNSVRNGGGIRVWNTTVAIRNNVIWGNHASSGAQIYAPSGAEVTYSDVEGGWAGQGNIDADPQLMPSDYLLGLSSPCIDSGNPDPVYYDPDSAGVAKWPARGARRNDMGAYGGPMAQRLATGIGGAVAEEESSTGGLALACVPRPVGRRAQLRFELGSAGPVLVQLVDVAGQVVRTIVDGRLSRGVHAISLDASGLAAGVYTCRLVTPSCQARQTLVRVR